MQIQVDFSSSEPIYKQVRTQIVLAIAAGDISDGETLPSVRDLAPIVGINFHTANKAYDLLREDGIIITDKRRGTVVLINKEKAREILKEEMILPVAKAICLGLPREEVLETVGAVYDEILGKGKTK